MSFPDGFQAGIIAQRRLYKNIWKSCNKNLYFFTLYKLADLNCHISCDHTAYNCEKIERTGVGSTGESSEIRFLSWSDVRFRRSTRFGWLDLLVSFGGVAGCFLGYSIITSLEGFYYFTLRTYCGAVLSVPKTRFNAQVQPRADVKRIKEVKEMKVVAYPDQLRQRYFLKDYWGAFIEKVHI